MAEDPFYGPDLATVHRDGFADVARAAAAVVLDHLRAGGVARGRVVDLGCGSGELAQALIQAGHEVLGVDVSPGMVALAREAAPGADLRCQSIHGLELPEAEVVTAVSEVLNYGHPDPVVAWERLAALTERVRRALTPGGLFLFDVCGPGRCGPAGRTERVRQGTGWFVVAVSTESDDGTRLDREITVFTETGDGCHRRSDEHHAQILFEPAAVTDLLDGLGFVVDHRSRHGPPGGPVPPPGWHVFAATTPPSRHADPAP